MFSPSGKPDPRHAIDIVESGPDLGYNPEPSLSYPPLRLTLVRSLLLPRSDSTYEFNGISLPILAATGSLCLRFRRQYTHDRSLRSSTSHPPYSDPRSLAEYSLVPSGSQNTFSPFRKFVFSVPSYHIAYIRCPKYHKPCLRELRFQSMPLPPQYSPAP